MKRIITLLITVVVMNINGYCKVNWNLDTALIVLKTAKEDTFKVKLLNFISWEKNAVNNNDESIKYADSALVLAEKIAYINGIADSYFRLGRGNSDLSNYSKALEYFQKALSINKQINNKEGIGRNYESIGIVRSE